MRQHDCCRAILWSGNLEAVREFLQGLPVYLAYAGEQGLWIGPPLPSHMPARANQGDWIVRTGAEFGIMRATGGVIQWAPPLPSLEQRLTWLLPSMTEFIEDAEKRAQESVLDDVFPHDATSLAQLRVLLEAACRRWLQRGE